MNHHGGVGSGIVQNAVPDHIHGAFKGFLRRLEHQFDRAFQLVFMIFQQLRRAQQHSCVHIVAAGVHRPIRAGIGQSRFLVNRQRVHIRPEHENLARLLSADGGNQSRSAAVRNLVTHSLQNRADIGFRLVQSEPGFRVGMKPLAVG